LGLLGNDTRKFLRHNLLTLATALDDPPESTMSAQRTVMVTLTDITAEWPRVTRNRNRQGLAALMPSTNRTVWERPASLFEVSPAAPGATNAFPAYICRWSGDSVCTKTLGHDADVMFTGNMNGCTFGIGMPANDGTVRVGHANAASFAGGTAANPDFTTQRQMQRDALSTRGVAANIVNPDVYRANVAYSGVGSNDFEIVAVTVGIRIGNKWEFYYQHQRHGGTRGDYRYEKMGTTKIG
jgi:hypothetical protein